MKTSYTMKEFRNLMYKAEESAYTDTVHLVVYANDTPGCYGFEEWNIPLEDIANFINVMCATYNVTSIEVADSKYDYDWINIDLYNNKVDVH